MSAGRDPFSAYVRRTPLLPLGTGIYAKAESLQTRGSYKIRGLANVFRRRGLDAFRGGVSSVSAGNLGQSLAYLAAEFALPCRIEVPDSAPRVKKDAIRALGAELVERPFSEIWARVLEPSRDPSFVHPCFDEDLRAGYASIAEEMLSDEPRLDAIVVPYGLGGLCLGIATALERIAPGVRVYSADVVPEGKSSLADAIGTPARVPEIHRQVSPLLAGCVAVREAAVADSIRRLYRDFGLPVEGAAAVAYAAAERLRKENGPEKIGCLLTGRNIDPEKLFGLL
ncbi:MAG: pyridoxal-phosphate dependent enzyme [Bdellovibrionales bacterium]|nr:pyridoxal-phosphate dependent enzyme [Bdellovibrionales bacterium]